MSLPPAAITPGVSVPAGQALTPAALRALLHEAAQVPGAPPGLRECAGEAAPVPFNRTGWVDSERLAAARLRACVAARDVVRAAKDAAARERLEPATALLAALLRGASGEGAPPAVRGELPLMLLSAGLDARDVSAAVAGLASSLKRSGKCVWGRASRVE